MEINWVILGWLIDMTLNGFVWLIIAAVSLLLIDVSDKWTRKAVKWMDKADKWIRKFIDELFEWIQKKESCNTLQYHIVNCFWYSCSTRNNTQANNLIKNERTK